MSPLSRNDWVRCPGGCGTPMPEGQTCFDCAAAATMKWKEEKLALAKLSFRKAAKKK